ncbi:hypothetical protein GCM10010123_35900 [Pilimelia anulata]|uniref:histidine kinase n=1 Tax=Pilimelia anulata TaxID=53371 RepID=A0A8J3B890_9ACTN|nr:ATP-binding protein [Pilimelia anulata]GGK02755.1 hypothetical protein GCM10010123_35900 [Pilimelia anulata]
MDKGTGSRCGRRSAGALAGLVVVLSAAIALGAGAALAAGQRHLVAEQLDRRAAAAADAVGAEANRYVDTLRTVAGALSAHPTLTRGAFDTSVAALRDLRLAGASSVAYLVPATDAAIPATRALWRGRGVPGLTLSTERTGREHYFSVLSVPLDGSNAARLGVDASRAAAPARALAAARRTGDVALSAAYQLLIDRALPADQRQMSFTLTAPVYGPATAGAARPFRGWVLLGIRGRDFMSAALSSRSAADLVDVALTAADDSGRAVTIDAHRAAVEGRRDVVRDLPLAVAGQQWRLAVAARGAALVTGGGALPAVVAGAGTLVALLLGGLVWALATGRSRARSAVAAATAELAAERTRAEEQAHLLGAILDSISDGVGVVDADGEFLLHNPAAREMLGAAADRDGPEHWQEHYGILRPDGETPFPTDELPLVRALRGEATEQVPMVLRNAAHPAGLHISVSGRPLRGLGQSGAVAVFHDISRARATEERLRELDRMKSQFIATVSHELRTPLTSIRGYTELLADTDTLGPTEQRMVKVIDDNGQRLLELIEDLLTFTRIDQGGVTLSRGAVDVAALLDRCLAAMSGTARTADVALAAEVSADLPVLDADAAQLERALLNLLSNAVKFSAPGDRVTVTARADGARLVLAVADTGTGIPDDEQAKLFTRFFRADRARRDAVPGTGLGLAIAKAIVDAHGGSIRAESAVGIGTTMTVRLPHAA